jgi:(2Fe-2S) ferredoxin
MQLKARVKQRWPDHRIRVSQTGCLGVCEEGPNVMIYPQNLWFRQVTPADVDGILSVIEKLIKKENTSDKVTKRQSNQGRL